MECNHHQLRFELEDSWLEISNMKLFKPKQLHYSYANQIDDREVSIINISDIAPCILRSKLKGVFCDKSPQVSAKDRVVSILKGFRNNSLIQPIEIKYFDGVGDYKFQMYHGSHRLHCAIAVGFTKIPAIFSCSRLGKNRRAIS